MKFLCGSCRTKYQISDEKVRGKILTIRCKKCGAKILVRESLARDVGGGTAVAPVAEEERAAQEEVQAQAQQQGRVARVGGSAALASAYDVAMGGGETAEADDMPTSIAPVPANLDIAGVEWYVAIDGVQHGPYAFAEIVEKLRKREVIGRHYVWHDGMDNWQRVRDVEDLNTYLPPPKKKPPPVPPPSVETKPPRSSGQGADVVDIASKRAERARGLGSSPVEDDVSDSDATAVESAGPLSQAASATTSDRAEQLDSVLNEALGIEGEGTTTQAQPEAAASASAIVGKPEKTPTIDDLLAFEAKADDIFANVPRADDEDEPVRESTRFFVAAAGVNQKRKRNRVGLLIGATVGAMVALFMGLWALGIINVEIPGIGNPFHSDKKEAEEIALADGEEDGDFEYLLVGKERKKVRRRRRPKRPRKTANSGGSDYIDDSESGASGGTRGGGPESVTIGDLPGGGPSGAIGVGDTQLPSTGIEDVQPPDRAGGLTPNDIKQVIAARKGAVQSCFERSLRAQEDLGGKIEFRVTVQPSGKVSKATVDTTAFSGSKLGNCVAKKIKTWRFPRFTGEPQQILVPFILARNSY